LNIQIPINIRIIASEAGKSIGIGRQNDRVGLSITAGRATTKSRVSIGSCDGLAQLAAGIGIIVFILEGGDSNGHAG
jgi:hypothetical protein